MAVSIYSSDILNRPQNQNPPMPLTMPAPSTPSLSHSCNKPSKSIGPFLFLASAANASAVDSHAAIPPAPPFLLNPLSLLSGIWREQSLLHLLNLPNSGRLCHINLRRLLVPLQKWKCSRRNNVTVLLAAASPCPGGKPAL